MRLILISLSKCELLSFSFRFLNENQSHYHSHFGRQGKLPCAFVQIRHLPPRITCQRACANPTIFGSVQIRWEIFFICANPTMNFPKNSSNPQLRCNPAGFTRVCANPTSVKVCESDKIFVTSIGGCVVVWVCGRVDAAREN
ncbi:hypothetical protein HWD22_gp001 [Salmonella phage bombadil]|uniref:Uncharacterized protein n=1 Tax=Salmonella phage bombadil TaxID=2713285 RepID=A0A6G8RDA0_9CAUD|nr:hypothetical protein HWD22_gp001 [Salmonella phage bombadil]QIN99400.1 hypothetical protein bombadil_1 [Salmonella phage bombadil]